MKLILIEVFDLLGRGRSALDDSFSCGITGNVSLINRINNGTFKLMMEVHRCLPFVINRIGIQDLLVLYAGNVAEL